MKKRFEELNLWFQNKAKELGFDFFPIHWEVVPEEVLLEIMSYGLPTRFRHWSNGQAYQYNKLQGSMGLSKVYELILNSNPSYAFLLETNSDIANLMVIAHCYGHSTVFKHNYLFQDTDRQMVYRAAERAQRIDDYINQYGIDKVEHVLDMALSMDKNIHWEKGVVRKPYPMKKKTFKEKRQDEFADLYTKDLGGYEEITLNKDFPPQREYDLLWFFANYAELESWQKDILEIVRDESFYFYPQYFTKIIHEGFASFTHAELMYLLPEELLSNSEYLEFLKIHERVVQPGASKMDINPYYLGFTIFTDIKKCWDEKFQKGESLINGYQKIVEVMKNEDDVSFIRNYLTQDLVDQMKLFTFIHQYDQNRNQYIEIKSTNVKDVVEGLISKMYDYRAPVIYIEKASAAGIELVHDSTSVGTLDAKHIEKVMEYIFELWKGMVDLKTIDEKGEEIHFTYDELGWSGPSESD